VPQKPAMDDDAGLFALEFGGLRELAAQEFDEAARAGGGRWCAVNPSGREKPADRKVPRP